MGALARPEVCATLGQARPVAATQRLDGAQVFLLRVAEEADGLDDRPVLAETGRGRPPGERALVEPRDERFQLVGNLAQGLEQSALIRAVAVRGRGHDAILGGAREACQIAALAVRRR